MPSWQKARKVMEDRYLFKAKIKENNNTGYKELDWIIGNLVVEQSTGRHFIIDLSHFDENTKLCDVMVEVDPSTICRCTELKDKSGKLIWENDICDRKEQYPEIVKYCNGDWTLDYSYASHKESGACYCNLGFYAEERKCMEVIGNIFDNPELLEVQK
jgi:uncharacterized phage protein (TIGR01671 family)